MRASRLASNPVADWHQGRAAAESVKTLCWRYAVCANPFGRQLDDAAVDREFVQRLDEILEQLSGLHVMPPAEQEDEQITPWMRETRVADADRAAGPLQDRAHRRPASLVRQQGTDLERQQPALGHRRAAAGVPGRRDGRRQPQQHGGLREVRARHPPRRDRRRSSPRPRRGPRQGSSATWRRRTRSPTRSSPRSVASSRARWRRRSGASSSTPPRAPSRASTPCGGPPAPAVAVDAQPHRIGAVTGGPDLRVAQLGRQRVGRCVCASAWASSATTRSSWTFRRPTALDRRRMA